MQQCLKPRSLPSRRLLATAMGQISRSCDAVVDAKLLPADPAFKDARERLDKLPAN